MDRSTIAAGILCHCQMCSVSLQQLLYPVDNTLAGAITFSLDSCGCKHPASDFGRPTLSSTNKLTATSFITGYLRSTILLVK